MRSQVDDAAPEEDGWFWGMRGSINISIFRYINIYAWWGGQVDYGDSFSECDVKQESNVVQCFFTVAVR